MDQKAFLTDTDDPIDIRIDGVFKAVFTKETPAARAKLDPYLLANTCNGESGRAPKMLVEPAFTTPDRPFFLIQV